MRGLGWNPDLLGPQWARLEGLNLDGAWVAGEAALCGYWLHHRGATGLELHAGPSAFDRLLTELGEVQPLFEGYARSGGLELVRELEPPLEPSTCGPVPAASLADLAVDRWLRAFGAESSATWLVDLYFLERSRVDLAQAVSAMTRKDLAATRRTLAAILHETRLTQLPSGLLRPVSLLELEDFRRRWTDQLAWETFS